MQARIQAPAPLKSREREDGRVGYKQSNGKCPTLNDGLHTLHQQVDCFQEITYLGHQAATALVAQAVEGGWDRLETLPNTEVDLHLQNRSHIYTQFHAKRFLELSLFVLRWRYSRSPLRC